MSRDIYWALKLENDIILDATFDPYQMSKKVNMNSHRKIPHLVFHLVNFSGALSPARAGIVDHSARIDQGQTAVEVQIRTKTSQVWNLNSFHA